VIKQQKKNKKNGGYVQIIRYTHVVLKSPISVYNLYIYCIIVSNI